MGMMLPTLQQIFGRLRQPEVSSSLHWWACPERHSAMVVNVVLRWTHVWDHGIRTHCAERRLWSYC